MAINSNQLAVLNLIACDYSYNPNPAVGDPLSTFRDSGTSNEYLPPDHLFTRVGLDAGTGPVSGFWNEVILPDWEVQSKYDDSNTGFSLVVFQNAAKTDVIVAITGTNGPDAQDWYSNLNLGKTQWDDNADDVRRLLNELKNADGSPFTGSLNFTGQSLGGGLAQYALLDYAKSVHEAHLLDNDKPDFDPAKATLTTYNAFGGLDGINEMYQGFDTSLVSSVATRHYVTTNDLVSRLGGGHLNGAGNTLLLDFQYKVEGGLPLYDEVGNVVDTTNERYYAPDFVQAHRIETGFYRWFAELGTDFSAATPYEIQYIRENAVRALGAAMSAFLNDNDHGPTESVYRAIVAITTTLALGDSNGLREAGTEMLKHITASASSGPGSMFKTALQWTVPTVLSSIVQLPQAKAALLSFAVAAMAGAAAVDAKESFGEWLADIRAAMPPAVVPLDDGMLDALAASSTPGEAMLKAGFAAGLLGNSLPGDNGTLAGLTLDPAELSQALAANDWTTETLGLVARAASAAGLGVAPILAAAGKFQRKSKKAASRCQEALDADTEKAKAELWQKVFGTRFFPSAISEERTFKSDASFNNTEEFIEDKFPLRIRYDLDVDCDVGQEATSLRARWLREKFPWLDQGRSLHFRVVHCNVPHPDAFLWKVRNVGPVARQRGIRGQIVTDAGRGEKFERTDFPGPHYVECYAIKDGYCVARDRIEVPIGTA